MVNEETIISLITFRHILNFQFKSPFDSDIYLGVRVGLGVKIDLFCSSKRGSQAGEREDSLLGTPAFSKGTEKGIVEGILRNCRSPHISEHNSLQNPF